MCRARPRVAPDVWIVFRVASRAGGGAAQRPLYQPHRLTGAYAIASGSTFGATLEPGEANPSFGSGTAWWTWTAPASGRVEIRFDPWNYEPVSVYTGAALPALSLVTNGFSPSFSAVRGTAYQIQVAKPSFSSGGPLSFPVALIAVEVSSPTNFADFRAPATFDIEAAPLALDITFASVTFLENDTAIATLTAPPWRLRRVDLPVGYRTNRVVATDVNGITTTSAPVVVVITPSHDDFANRIRLAGAPVSLPTLFGPATSETGEPLLYTNVHRVWYSWTAPHSGVARVWAEGPQQFIDIFRGETLQTLTRCVTDHGGLFRIEEGQVYQIGVAGWFPFEEPHPAQSILRIEAYQLPVNENFANRLPLPGASVTVPASNFTFAALEPGEPRHVTYGAGRSVWWTWTAPASGVVSLRTTGHTFTTAIAAYTGTDLATLTEVAAGAYAPPGFFAFAGVSYQIAVDVYGGDYGFFDLHLDFTPMPRAPNDDFANRLRIGLGTIRGSNTAATREPNEPMHRDSPGQRSVWYAWTSPGFGRLGVFATSASFYPLVAVYTGGSLAALTTPTGSGSDSSFYCLVQPGVEYQIAVDGMSGANGPFELALDYVPPPGNDNFANRIAIQGFPVTRQGSNTFATAEPGEPRHFSNPNFNFSNSVWYTWTAPVNGLVTADVRPPPEQSFDWNIAGVYTGNAVDALTLVVNGSSSVTWQAQQGVTYQIAVDGYWQASFTLRLLGPPPNNHFADRIPLTGATNLLTASNVGATLEPFEPAINTFDPGGRSVWWTWIAPADGEAELQVSEHRPGPDLQPLLGIYSGTTLNGLSLLSRSRNGRVRFFVSAGAVYQIQVDGSFGRSTEFTLFLRLLPPAPPLSFNLANVRRLPDGRVRLPVSGRLEDYLILEASSDLQTWQEVDREELEASTGLFIDTSPVNLPRRFYRVRNWSAGGDGF